MIDLSKNDDSMVTFDVVKYATVTNDGMVIDAKRDFCLNNAVPIFADKVSTHAAFRKMHPEGDLQVFAKEGRVPETAALAEGTTFVMPPGIGFVYPPPAASRSLKQTLLLTPKSRVPTSSARLSRQAEI